jgi:hypothetical protein
MPLMNRILGALRGAASPGHQGGHARPGAGHTPGARPGGARSGGLGGIVTSLLRGRGRRRGL